MSVEFNLKAHRESLYDHAFDGVMLCIKELTAKLSALDAAHVLDIEHLRAEHNQLKETQIELTANRHRIEVVRSPCDAGASAEEDDDGIPLESHNRLFFDPAAWATPFSDGIPLPSGARCPAPRRVPTNGIGAASCTVLGNMPSSPGASASSNLPNGMSNFQLTDACRDTRSSSLLGISDRSEDFRRSTARPSDRSEDFRRSAARPSNPWLPRSTPSSISSVSNFQLDTMHTSSLLESAEQPWESAYSKHSKKSCVSFKESPELEAVQQATMSSEPSDLSRTKMQSYHSTFVSGTATFETSASLLGNLGNFEVCELLRQGTYEASSYRITHHEPTLASDCVMNGTMPSTLSFSRKGFIIHPTSPIRFAWETLGALMLLYDMLVIPLQVFEIPKNEFLETMGWTTLVYWTGDIFVSCFSGYYSRDGECVTNLRKIILHYAKSWFLLDLLIVGVDWFPVVMSVEGGGRSGSRQSDNSQGTNLEASEMFRIAKVMRMLRLMRLLRILKLTQSIFILMVQERMESIRMYMFANLLKNILSILLINHFCACIWYGVGTIDVPGRTSWVKKYEVDQRTWMFGYLTSFHWSMAQFANGEILIEPQNVPERIMSICVLMASMVVFSSFLAVVGNAVHQLIQQKAAQRTEHWLLRLFLRQNNTSLDLRMRVNRYVSLKLFDSDNKVKQSEVKLFEMLSPPLQVELYTELYLATLTMHRFFLVLSRVSLSIVRNFCCHAVRRFSLSLGDTLFAGGEESNCMYFMDTGQMHYSAPETEQQVRCGDSFCEAALWAVRWLTMGRMSAISECEMLALERQAVHLQMQRFHTTNMRLPRKYAVAFINALNEKHRQGSLTDMHSDLVCSGPVQLLLDNADRSAKQLEMTGRAKKFIRGSLDKMYSPPDSSR